MKMARMNPCNLPDLLPRAPEALDVTSHDIERLSSRRSTCKGSCLNVNVYQQY